MQQRSFFGHFFLIFFRNGLIVTTESPCFQEVLRSDDIAPEKKRAADAVRDAGLSLLQQA